MKKITALKSSENVIYAGFWLALFLFPPFYMGEMVIEGNWVKWLRDVMHVYEEIIPFFILFLVNTFLLMPFLYQRGKRRGYFFALSGALILFMGYQFVISRHHCAPPKHRTEISAGTITSENCDRNVSVQRHRLPKAGYDRPRSRHLIPWPVLLHTIIAILMIGAELGIKFIFTNFRNEKRIAELERLNATNELNYLKAQISPHFFMNVLNNIHGLIETDAPQAQQLILEMSKLMRYVLYESATQRVPLKTELEFVENLVSLMRGRYSSKKVDVELTLPDTDEISGKSLPPLLFIVFIENAFKHGISYRDKSYIKIVFSVKDDRLTFFCLNTIPSHFRETGKGGVGLINVKKRLEMIYGNDFVLEKKIADNNFSIILNVPLYENKMHSCR